jgi:hypothetical protein
LVVQSCTRIFQVDQRRSLPSSCESFSRHRRDPSEQCSSLPVDQRSRMISDMTCSPVQAVPVYDGFVAEYAAEDEWRKDGAHRWVEMGERSFCTYYTIVGIYTIIYTRRNEKSGDFVCFNCRASIASG